MRETGRADWSSHRVRIAVCRLPYCVCFGRVLTEPNLAISTTHAAATGTRSKETSIDQIPNSRPNSQKQRAICPVFQSNPFYRTVPYQTKHRAREEEPKTHAQQNKTTTKNTKSKTKCRRPKGHQDRQMAVVERPFRSVRLSFPTKSFAAIEASQDFFGCECDFLSFFVFPVNCTPHSPIIKQPHQLCAPSSKYLWCVCAKIRQKGVPLPRLGWPLESVLIRQKKA
ncbi:hypothetical protein IWX47DRAFT_715762 [Phyllosticta citricarpa]